MTNLLLINTFSCIFLIAAVVLAIVVAVDMRSRPQSMKIMRWVWVLTMLWSSVLGFIAYFVFGREKKMENMAEGMKMDGMDMSGMKSCNAASKPKMEDMAEGMKMDGMDMSGMKSGDVASKPEMEDMAEGMKMDGMSMPMPNRPKWQSVALSALHCGAGCTLADIIGESFSGFHPVAIAGSFVIGAWVIDYILALIIGVYFQYVAIREMQNISAGEALLRAVKADFLSLTAWQIGMYGWMYVVIFILFKDQPLSKTSVEFWFMMQIAMLCGFITAYPMNALLVKLGIKKGM